MKRYKVSYKVETVSANTTIVNDGYSCISFENQGTTMAYLNDVAVLPPYSQIRRFFNEEPDIEINSYFNVSFDTAETTADRNSVLIVKSYYTEY